MEKSLSASRIMSFHSGSLEDKIAERNADNGKLACEVSEGIKYSVRDIHAMSLN